MSSDFGWSTVIHIVQDVERGSFTESDGVFYMSYTDWRNTFTHCFVAINFPPTYAHARVKFQWTSNVAGHRLMRTWMSNPRIQLKLEASEPSWQRVYVGLTVDDARMTHGIDCFKAPLQSTALSFDILSSTKVQAMCYPMTSPHTMVVGRRRAASSTLRC
jgi:hypothetical protein